MAGRFHRYEKIVLWEARYQTMDTADIYFRQRLQNHSLLPWPCLYQKKKKNEKKKLNNVCRKQRASYYFFAMWLFFSVYIRYLFFCFSFLRKQRASRSTAHLSEILYCFCFIYYFDFFFFLEILPCPWVREHIIDCTRLCGCTIIVIWMGKMRRKNRNSLFLFLF